MFGRKVVDPSPAREISPAISENFIRVGELQGHIATIEHAKVAGEFFFEILYQKMASAIPGEPVGLENFVALLSSAGGVACIATSLCEFEIVRMRDPETNWILEQQVGGHSYFIGDLPGRYLYECKNSLLNIALMYARKCGADIRHDFLHEPIAHAQRSIGTNAFGVPRLPSENMPDALPFDLAMCAWPQAELAFEETGLALEWRPAALGFAIGKAIDTGAQALDPMILAKVAVECAVPMSTVDPSRFMDRIDTLRANYA